MAHVFDTSIDIDAPPQRVWEVLVDLPAWKEWNPFIPSISGKLEVGSRLELTVIPPGRKPVEFKGRRASKVFTLRPPEEVVFGGSFLWMVFRGDHAIFLEPLPGGRTHFRQVERQRGLLALFIPGGVIQATEQGYHQMNEALKRRVESKP